MKVTYPIIAEKTAMLVVDMQNDFVQEGAPIEVPHARAMVPRLNRLLDVYPGADGVKIGYTDLAQKTIVASAVHNGHRVYVSLLHSGNLVADSSAMFDWVWENFAWQ